MRTKLLVDIHVVCILVLKVGLFVVREFRGVANSQQILAWCQLRHRGSRPEHIHVPDGSVDQFDLTLRLFVIHLGITVVEAQFVARQISFPQIDRVHGLIVRPGTVVVGAFVILFDPIFQGLAISLMGGAIASTVLTLLVVPLVHFMMEGRQGGGTGSPS